jgi:hypothetical protein
VAGIQRLAVVDDAAGTDFGAGILAFEAAGSYLVSVIAANTAATDAEIYVYSVPFGTSGDPDLWALVAYKLPLPAYNSYETFRFGVNNTDSIYVAGSAGVRYFVQGIEQIG